MSGKGWYPQRVAIELLEFLAEEKPLASPGRDPMAQRGGEKVKFFKGTWRESWPEDFGVHRPDGAG